MDEDLLLGAEDDLHVVEFIKAYLPQEVKAHFNDNDIYYFIDLLSEYFEESGLLDQEPDADGTIEIDTEAVAEALAAKARKEHYGDFEPADVLWIVQGELEYGE